MPSQLPTQRKKPDVLVTPGFRISTGNWRPGVTSAGDTGAHWPVGDRQSAPYRVVRLIYSTKNTFLTRSKVVVALFGHYPYIGTQADALSLRRFRAANGSRKRKNSGPGQPAYVYDPPAFRFIPEAAQELFPGLENSMWEGRGTLPTERGGPAASAAHADRADHGTTATVDRIRARVSRPGRHTPSASCCRGPSCRERPSGRPAVVPVASIVSLSPGACPARFRHIRSRPSVPSIGRTALPGRGVP